MNEQEADFRRNHRMALADAELARKPKRVRPMSPSERLDAAARLQPTSWDEMARAEKAVRDGGMGPMFSEHDTYTDFHFGTDIPTGRVTWYDGHDELAAGGVDIVPRREFQSSDDMAATAKVSRDARAFIGVLFVALGVVLLLAWAGIQAGQ